MELLTRAVPGAVVVETPLRARPAFLDRDVDLCYIGSSTERGQAIAASALAPWRDEISARIDDGARILATGNAPELFGEYIDCGDGHRVECLGLFGVHAKRDMLNRYNGLFLGKYDNIDIVGFKSQFSHMWTDSEDDDEALFEVVRGAGRRPGDRREGLRRNNFMASYLLGPLLIVNPPFAKQLLRDMGADTNELPFERAAMDAYDARLREFRDPKTGFGG
jgi:CobQ-like glutamine amidotransferase family enzyme